MASIKGLTFKLYDTRMADEERSDYWDKTMQEIYFSNPEAVVRAVSCTGMYSLMEQFLPESGIFLDGGCGSNYLAKMFDTDCRKIVGIDFAINNLVKGKEVYPEAWSVAGDLNNLPFRDNTFDGVLSISTAEHVETGPTKLFQETCRVLKSGGVFLLMVPTYNAEDVFFHMMGRARGVPRDALSDIRHFHDTKLYKSVRITEQEGRKGFFAYWFNRRVVRKMLLGSGFEIKRTFPLDVMIGMTRSRIFGKYAAEYLKESLTGAMRGSVSGDMGWIYNVLIREDIFQSRLKYLLHAVIGTFYRYHLAFVCIKRS